MQFSSDLLAYFEEIQLGDYRHHTEAGIHLLNRDEAISVTGLMQYHPLVGGLQGIVLDDPNTSNHHVYLIEPPFSGYVLYLAHDGGTRIMFSSLNDFLQTVEQAIAQGEDIHDLHPKCSPVVANQAALCALIEKDFALNLDNALTLACIPSLDLTNFSLLHQLVNSDDFFLGDAVALEICKRPAENLRTIAELCSKHAHAQAAKMGQRALSAILRLRFAK
ncbi:hypothetical protein UNDYM_4117 [Undibacterium sp. YM2]|jgi:hypothetical protein|uniref:hypothetical protein n=1 Tax=Undibacterium sp. YM2 TaxID=2058625 RepID=UPI001331CA41|nr:hypothetical protein [Undibacterium sp. YM2]BBB68370.1 hypothetical protein UNDYM_4117 [Undibacterium sp. YM2]